jgi:ribosomal subunit interface protein
MQQSLQITFRGLPHSDAVDARIRERVTQLERFNSHVTSCHVTVEAPHQHQRQGQLYSVRIDMHVPDGEIVVNREHHLDHSHEDPYVAVRDAFDAATRQLQDYARRRRQVRRGTAPNAASF